MWGDVEQAFRDGLHNVALAVAGFLPGVLSMLLVLAFAVALAYLVRFALRRSLLGVDFDRRVHRWGLTSTGEWTPNNAPSALTAHAGFWFVLLVGFFAGLQALGTRVTDALASRVLGYIPSLLAAGLIFLVGLALARFLERAVLVSAVNMQIQSARVVSLGVKWLVVLFATALTLQHLQVGGSILTVSFAIVFGGIVLAVALAVGLGSREAVSRSWERSWQHENEKRATGNGDEIRHM
jgi:hypothetical protein